jgi:hypothetical protein
MCNLLYSPCIYTGSSSSSSISLIFTKGEKVTLLGLVPQKIKSVRNVNIPFLRQFVKELIYMKQYLKPLIKIKRQLKCLGLCLFSGSLVSSTNKTNRRDRTETWLKVALNNIVLTLYISINFKSIPQTTN